MASANTVRDNLPLTDLEFDVIAALTEVEIAEAGLRSRLRDHLNLNPTDLAAVQYIARAATAERSVYAKDLASVLGVTSAASTLIVDRLVKAGHVERTRDPANGRYRRLTLTPATDELLEEATGDTQRQLRDLVTSMSDRDRKRAVAVLKAISSAFDDGAPRRPGAPGGV
jgi:DNA-binding MarR family transcriptional regulator